MPKYAYDPAKAKALLAEAGLAGGFEFDLYAYREREFTEAVIGDLVKVGIRPKLNYVQYTAFLENVRKGKTPSRTAPGAPTRCRTSRPSPRISSRTGPTT